MSTFRRKILFPSSGTDNKIDQIRNLHTQTHTLTGLTKNVLPNKIKENEQNNSQTQRDAEAVVTKMN